MDWVRLILHPERQEGEHACLVALEGLKDASYSDKRLSLEGLLLAWRTHFCRLSGSMELARQFSHESLRLLEEAEEADKDTRRGQALLWRECGYLAVSLTEQLDCFMQSAALFQDLGDVWWQAMVLSWAGELVNRLGDRDRSKTILEKAVVLSQEAGEPRRLANSLTMLAYHQLIFGPWKTGVKSMEQASGWYRSVGDLSSQAHADLYLGMSLGWVGRYPEACEKIEKAIELFTKLGDCYYVTFNTLALAIGKTNSGRYEKADKTLQKSLVAAHNNGFRREEAFGMVHMGCLKSLMGKAEQALADIRQGVAGFRQMEFAGELGMALGGLALAYHRLGQEKLACESIQEALHIAVETHSRFTLFTLPAALVILLVDAGRWEQAVEAYSAVMTDPAVANSRWFADMVDNRMEIAREQLTEEAYQAAETRGWEGDVFEVFGRLSHEIESWGMAPDQGQEPVQ